MPASRSGFQAVANAIWSLVGVVSRAVNVTHFGGSAGAFASGRPEVNTTHFGGSAGMFSAGKPHAITTTLILHGDVAFGTGETGKASNISALGAANVNEIDLTVHGPWHVITSTGGEQAISARVSSATEVFFEKTTVSGAGTAVASTHYFTVKRRVS